MKRESKEIIVELIEQYDLINSSVKLNPEADTFIIVNDQYNADDLEKMMIEWLDNTEVIIGNAAVINSKISIERNKVKLSINNSNSEAGKRENEIETQYIECVYDTRLDRAEDFELPFPNYLNLSRKMAELKKLIDDIYEKIDDYLATPVTQVKLRAQENEIIYNSRSNRLTINDLMIDSPLKPNTIQSVFLDEVVADSGWQVNEVQIANALSDKGIKQNGSDRMYINAKDEINKKFHKIFGEKQNIIDQSDGQFLLNGRFILGDRRN